MQIIHTFEIVPESLYSVLYENEAEDEFNRLFENWNDPMYLEEFFEEHKDDLQSGFWRNITIEKAILRTIREAGKLEEKLLQIAEDGKTDRFETLSTLFKPLHDNTIEIGEFERNKLKGQHYSSWLRIYAIRIKPNLFLISGGAIKLTRTMNDRVHLIKELKKLDITKQFLEECEDVDSFPIFELFL